MITIYGSDLSWPTKRVRFAAHLLGIEYDYRRMNLFAGEHQKPEFLQLNPVGKIPVLVDEGFVLSESGAIIKYLCNKTNSPLYPSSLRDRALVDQWIDFAVIHVGISLQKITFNKIYAPRLNVPVDERAIQDGQNFLTRFLPIVDKQLSINSYLAGPALTIADISLLAILEPAEQSQVDLSVYPHLNAWRENLKKQDFYLRCIQNISEPASSKA